MFCQLENNSIFFFRGKMFQAETEKIEANYNKIKKISENPFVAMDFILAYLASTSVSNLYQK